MERKSGPVFGSSEAWLSQAGAPPIDGQRWGPWLVAGKLQGRGEGELSPRSPFLAYTREIVGHWCEREQAHSLRRTKRCHEVSRHSGGPDRSSDSWFQLSVRTAPLCASQLYEPMNSFRIPFVLKRVRVPFFRNLSAAFLSKMYPESDHFSPSLLSLSWSKPPLSLAWMNARASQCLPSPLSLPYKPFPTQQAK